LRAVDSTDCPDFANVGNEYKNLLKCEKEAVFLETASFFFVVFRESEKSAKIIIFFEKLFTND